MDQWKKAVKRLRKNEGQLKLWGKIVAPDSRERAADERCLGIHRKRLELRQGIEMQRIHGFIDHKKKAK
jgi:hypothetical protein